MKVYCVLYSSPTEEPRYHKATLMGTFLRLEQAKRYCEETLDPWDWAAGELKWQDDPLEVYYSLTIYQAYQTRQSGYVIIGQEVQE